jgi:hypothetical protein
MTDKADETLIETELETLKAQVFPNIEEGSLLVITVGNENVSASESDMERVSEIVDVVFGDLLGVKVLVVPHSVQIDRLPLPALRDIQSQVVNSFSPSESSLVAGDFNVFGGS